MRLLSLSLAIILGGLAGAILIGGATVLSIPAGLIALLLPAAGLAALLRDKAPPELGVIGWSVLVVLGAPLWLDRGAALSAVGLADLEPLLPTLHRPEPAAPTSPAPLDEALTSFRDLPPPPVDHNSDDLVVLPYEGTARSMMLAVALESERVLLETEMVFDTGATLTTISPQLLKDLEIEIPADAPTLQLQTANGVRSSPLLLLERLWLGGFAVEGVSVSVCDNCGDLNGLIGLNVSSMFRIEVDQQNRELTFHPEEGDRHLDIAHWLSFSLLRGRGELSVTAKNRSTRTIRDAVIQGSCGESASAPITVTLPEISPDEEATATFPAPLTCSRPTVSLIGALW